MIFKHVVTIREDFPSAATSIKHITLAHAGARVWQIICVLHCDWLLSYGTPISKAQFTKHSVSTILWPRSSLLPKWLISQLNYEMGQSQLCTSRIFTTQHPLMRQYCLHASEWLFMRSKKHHSQTASYISAWAECFSTCKSCHRVRSHLEITKKKLITLRLKHYKGQITMLSGLSVCSASYRWSLMPGLFTKCSWKNP